MICNNATFGYYMHLKNCMPLFNQTQMEAIFLRKNEKQISRFLFSVFKISSIFELMLLSSKLEMQL